MPVPTQSTTHVADTVDLLISRYKKAKVVSGMVTSLSQEVQELEDAAWQVINAMVIGAAPMGGGPWDIYDKIAAIVGVPGGRLGRNDTDLLAAIKIQIRVNRSNGLAEDIIQITALLVATGATYYDAFPASFIEQVLGTTQPIADALTRYLGEARAVATGGSLVYTLVGELPLILESSRVALPTATFLDSSRTPGSFPYVLSHLRAL
jgi:hypothetical protein